MNDHLLFISRWLENPLGIGGILPSGKRLSKALASAVPSTREGIVVELGAGTGAVTRALLWSGIAPDDLFVIERDRGMCRRLVRRFPHVSVVMADARRIDEVPALRARGPARAVVSSLPLLAMSRAVRQETLEAAIGVLDDDGVFIQFTYGLGPPIGPAQRRSLELEAEPVARIWQNVPSATVWVFRRRGCRHGTAARPATAVASVRHDRAWTKVSETLAAGAGG